MIAPGCTEKRIVSGRPASTTPPAVALALLAALWAGLPGCSPYTFVPCEPRVTPALGEMRDGYANIQVLYATDRNQTGANMPAEIFGNARSRALTVGEAEVSIPEGHGRGRLEQPLIGSPEPRRDVALLSAAPFTDDSQFLASLRARVQASPRKQVFVFVHGYAVTFPDAVRRAAQMAHDMRFDGVPVAYSWPSRGWVASYLVDTATAEWSAFYLGQLLRLLVEESGAEHIHIVAHSMGSRVLTSAFVNFLARRALDGPDRSPASRPAREIDPNRPAFDQIVLAAADLDAEVFARDHAPLLAAACRRLTIYFSSSDGALSMSKDLHFYNRLGQGPLPDLDPALLRRIELVDVTSVDLDWLGHTYYGDSPAVIEDMRQTLDDERPAQRGLERVFIYRMPETNGNGGVHPASAAAAQP